MSENKIIQIVKREPTDKERYWDSFLKNAEALRAFLESSGKGGELYMTLSYLAMFLSASTEERMGRK